MVVFDSKISPRKSNTRPLTLFPRLLLPRRPSLSSSAAISPSTTYNHLQPHRTLDGRNATILAYGQTGSGKTYSMGTGFDVDLPAEAEGIVPRSVKFLFKRIEELKEEAARKEQPIPEFKVCVSFLELYMNTFFDLFDPTPGKVASNVKILDERNDDGTFSVKMTGITQLEVSTVEELMG